MKYLPTLLFDWDGVIVDSNSWKWEGAWEKVFCDEPHLNDCMKRVLNEDKDKRMTRTELVVAMANSLSNKHVPAHPLEYYIELYGNVIRDGADNSISLFPDALNTLLFLKERGFDMHVISMTAQNDLLFLANKLNVSSFFSSLNGTPLKKRDHVIRIVNENKLDQTYIVIGDGVGDMELASEFKYRFIGVNNKWNNWKQNSEMELKIDKLNELPLVLASLL